MVNFQDFPFEIIAYIVTFLKGKDTLNFSYVSKQIYSICKPSVIWKTKLKKDYPHVNIKNVKSYKKTYFKTKFTVLIHTDPDKVLYNIAKNAYSKKNSTMRFCSVLSTFITDIKEEELYKRKKVCNMLQEKYYYDDGVVKELIENDSVHTTIDYIGREMITDHLRFYSEEINRDLKHIYLLVSYFRDADEPCSDQFTQVNMAKFFKSKEEIEEWLKENLPIVSQTIYESPLCGEVSLCSAEMNDPPGRSCERGDAAKICDLEETKEYEYNGRTKLPYSEQVDSIMKDLRKFGSCELYYGHPMEDWRPYDSILVFKIPVHEQD